MLIFPLKKFRRPSGGDFPLNNQMKTLHFNLDLVSKSPAGAIFFLKRASGARFPLFFVLHFHFERLQRLDFLNFPQFCRNFLKILPSFRQEKKNYSPWKVQIRTNTATLGVSRSVGLLDTSGWLQMKTMMFLHQPLQVGGYSPR